MRVGCSLLPAPCSLRPACRGRSATSLVLSSAISCSDKLLTSGSNERLLACLPASSLHSSCACLLRLLDAESLKMCFEFISDSFDGLELFSGAARTRQRRSRSTSRTPRKGDADAGAGEARVEPQAGPTRSGAGQGARPPVLMGMGALVSESDLKHSLQMDKGKFGADVGAAQPAHPHPPLDSSSPSKVVSRGQLTPAPGSGSPCLLLCSLHARSSAERSRVGPSASRPLVNTCLAL